MTQIDWDKLRIFHVVSLAGSFTHAGDILGLSQSAVSRQIRSLEESLASSLFQRHPRGLILTEQGEILLITAKRLHENITKAETLLYENKQQPEGLLKVTTTVGFGSIWLTPHIAEFLDRYPQMKLSIIVGDKDLDLVTREADVAIRMTAPTQPELIQRKLFTSHLAIYASPKYLKLYGTPKNLKQLVNHRIVGFGRNLEVPFPEVHWLPDMLAKIKGDFKPSLTVNNIVGMVRAVENSVGIAALPTLMVQEFGGCVNILNELEGPSIKAYFVYPQELKSIKKVAIFRDFLLEKISDIRTKKNKIR